MKNRSATKYACVGLLFNKNFISSVNGGFGKLNKNDITDIRPADYFTAKTYAGFIFGKIKNGELWNGVSSIYKKIRKYTLISAIIRTAALVVSLLEKSALLLLFATSLLLLLPAILVIALIYVIVCGMKYFLWHKTVSAWLKNAEKITVYLSSEKIFVKKPPLFLRIAAEEASDYSHPVIVLCKDSFTSVKWYSLNLLAVKPDYFFILKNLFFGKKGVEMTYIALS